MEISLLNFIGDFNSLEIISFAVISTCKEFMFNLRGGMSKCLGGMRMSEDYALPRERGQNSSFND